MTPARRLEPPERTSRIGAGFEHARPFGSTLFSSERLQPLGHPSIAGRNPDIGHRPKISNVATELRAASIATR